jgi:hypothetical protein
MVTAMEQRGKRFANVEGKTVRFIECGLDENGQPRLTIEFTDAEVLDIQIKTTFDVSGEWAKDENGSLVMLPGKNIFD